jgi:lipopolysaccharide/colanic/teichoic acid biosynthesis glycosyltransferase
LIGEAPSITSAHRVWTDAAGAAAPAERTIWGLTPAEIHDRYWAARGVQVVRFGQRSQIVDGAELYLLSDPWLLTAFPPARVAERIYWAGASAAFVRLRDERQREYTERVVSDARDLFVCLERVYGATDSRFARVVLTPDRAIADAWQAANDAHAAWRVVRRMVPPTRRLIDRVRSRVFDSRDRNEVREFMQRLADFWLRPDITISRASQRRDGIWIDSTASVGDSVRILGSVWIGAGRQIPQGSTIVGPAVLWDVPEMRPPTEDVRWSELEPSASTYARALKSAHDRSRLHRAVKRIGDILFAAAALAVTLPLYPLVMLMILLDDGRPFFFSHERESVGGRLFRCWKFRSMRKDADSIKAVLKQMNQADGPQFFMKDDPRLTRVGRLIRRFNIDELPQFFNVLKGDMSVVGPRPSPRAENQFCPAWREARLSVRPGITGLWQVMRTRRLGMDFQEWIKYDLEYVERMGPRLDFKIICQTIRILLGGKPRC